MEYNILNCQLSGRNGNLLFELCGLYYVNSIYHFKHINVFFVIPVDVNVALIGWVEAYEILKNGLELQLPKFTIVDDGYNIFDLLDYEVSGYEEKNSVIYNERQKDINSNLYISGYNQTEKYWNCNRDFAINLFKPKQELMDIIYKYYSDYDFENLISINIRRGDYVGLKDIFGLCEEDYFNKCINYFGKDKKYLIVSDDIEWCKTIFKGDNFYFVDKEIQEFDKSLIDMFIMTLCRHNIISNSTFSWWGAYLNIHKDRTVLCPKPFFKWAPEENDIIPENDGWIEINMENTDDK